MHSYWYVTKIFQPRYDSLDCLHFTGLWNICLAKRLFTSGELTPTRMEGFMLQALVLSALIHQYTSSDICRDDRLWREDKEAPMQTITVLLDRISAANHKSVHQWVDPAIHYLKSNIGTFLAGLWTHKDVLRMFNMSPIQYHYSIPFPFPTLDTTLRIGVREQGSRTIIKPLSKSMTKEKFDKAEFHIGFNDNLPTFKEQMYKEQWNSIGKPAYGELMPKLIW